MAKNDKPTDNEPTDTTTSDAPEAEAPVRNLTQERIEGMLASRLQEAPPLGEGLSPAAAAAKAKRRAAEMCGLPPTS
jgi:hypothetical protein